MFFGKRKLIKNKVIWAIVGRVHILLNKKIISLIKNNALPTKKNSPSTIPKFFKTKPTYSSSKPTYLKLK